MSAVRITYLTQGGRYRRRRGQIDPSHPTFLINNKDKQAHSLRESPIFIRSTPVKLDNWGMLTGHDDDGVPVGSPVAAPAPPVRAEKLDILCEDNAIWPVNSLPYTDDQARQFEVADTHQEAYNLAQARQARETHGNLVLQNGFMLLVACCVLLVLVIAAVVADAKFGGGDTGPEAAITEDLPPWL